MEGTAYLFPGQGSQVIGMGKELYRSYSVARHTFFEADEALGFSLSELCFSGPEEELQLTSNAQPAIVTTSIAAYRVFSQLGYEPKGLAGHSLGEFSALVAAGSLDFTDAVKLVRLRGQLMEQAVPKGKGGMAAIMNLPAPIIEKICWDVEGTVEIANYNSPSQVVISGEKEALEKAMELAKIAGAKRVVELNVSGPFHSSLMADVETGLEEALAKLEVKDPAYPFYSNVTGSLVSDAFDVKSNLVKQVTNSVFWQKSMENMVDSGLNTFFVFGEGKALCSFLRGLSRPNIVSHQVSNLKDLDKTMEALNIVEKIAGEIS